MVEMDKKEFIRLEQSFIRRPLSPEKVVKDVFFEKNRYYPRIW